MSKLQKKSKEIKTEEYNKLQNYVKDYRIVLFIKLDNYSTKSLHYFREVLKENAKICSFKKTAVLRVFKNVSEYFSNGIFLLFTNLEYSEIVEILLNLKDKNWIPNGVAATVNITLPKGILCHENKVEVNVLFHKKLKELGLPAVIKHDKLELNEDYDLIKENEVIDKNKYEILKILKYKIGEVKIQIICGMENLKLIK
ncbi:ribosomal protein L10 [Hamiltosporidium magnivora]|uniref:Ribosomal protein L10 n=1 Tax=Hamiltosporidium magnivora TaxID=148818 RepID=A0A4Q9L2M6_9MICR|nr:ribosomal protein L10 [Hamiltosporidium magnivora]